MYTYFLQEFFSWEWEKHHWFITDIFIINMYQPMHLSVCIKGLQSKNEECKRLILKYVNLHVKRKERERQMREIQYKSDFSIASMQGSCLTFRFTNLRVTSCDISMSVRDVKSLNAFGPENQGVHCIDLKSAFSWGKSCTLSIYRQQNVCLASCPLKGRISQHFELLNLCHNKVIFINIKTWQANPYTISSSSVVQCFLWE